MMTAELLDLLVRMTPPSHRLEVVDNNNEGLEMSKAVITANSHVKRRLADLRADLAVLEFELKLLTQLLYKLHNRFRNDRGYKALRILEKSGEVCLITPVVEHVFYFIFILSLCLKFPLTSNVLLYFIR